MREVWGLSKAVCEYRCRKGDFELIFTYYARRVCGAGMWRQIESKRGNFRQISTASLWLLCAARSERISIRVIVLAFARNSLGTAASRGYFTKKVHPGLVLRICRKLYSAKLRDLCFSFTRTAVATRGCQLTTWHAVSQRIWNPLDLDPPVQIC